MSHKERLPQGEGTERLLQPTMVLVMLLDGSPHSILAANTQNITAGLVRVLHQFSSKPHNRVQNSHGTCLAIDFPLLCLIRLMELDNEKELGAWKPAYDAGLAPVLCNLLTSCEEPAVSKVLRLSMALVRVTPPGNEGQWAGRLPREIARLLTAKPLVAAAQAINALFMRCGMHLQLLVECHNWGLGDSLKELAYK